MFQNIITNNYKFLEFKELNDEEPLYDDNGELIEGDEKIVEPSTTTTTTTEAPKRIGPKIRPFRSNEDLLSALKRRQQNAKLGKKDTPPPKTEDRYEESYEKPSPAPTQPPRAAPASSSSSSGNLNNKIKINYFIYTTIYFFLANRRRFGGPKLTQSSVPVQEQQSLEENSAVPRRPARGRFLASN